MNTAALIIASGNRSPRQGPLDATAKVGSLSALQRIIMTFHLAQVSPIVVVVAEAERKKIEADAARYGVVFLLSETPDAQMFENVCQGLRYLAPMSRHVMVTPANVPLFTAETIAALAGCGRSLAAPLYHGRRGHPLLIGSNVIPSLLTYQGPDGLRGAIRNCEYKFYPIEVEDEGILIKSSGAADHETAIADHTLNRLRPVVKLQLAKETVFLGPGTRHLLSLIDSCGSVRLACQQMGISYSKGWKMLTAMEQQLQFEVVSRKQGGKQGGESRLSPAGQALLNRYDRFEADCLAQIEQLFATHFERNDEDEIN